MTIQEMKIKKMQQALDHYDYVSDAAKALGIRHETLWRNIKRHGLEVTSSKQNLKNHDTTTETIPPKTDG
jgi:DNA-binding NtrC family response regulator